MVHRMLAAGLSGAGAVESKETLQEISLNCNARKTNADRASDRSDVVFLCHLLKDAAPRELEVRERARE